MTGTAVSLSRAYIGAPLEVLEKEDKFEFSDERDFDCRF